MDFCSKNSWGNIAFMFIICAIGKFAYFGMTIHYVYLLATVIVKYNENLINVKQQKL